MWLWLLCVGVVCGCCVCCCVWLFWVLCGCGCCVVVSVVVRAVVVAGATMSTVATVATVGAGVGWARFLAQLTGREATPDRYSGLGAELSERLQQKTNRSSAR